MQAVGEFREKEYSGKETSTNVAYGTVKQGEVREEKEEKGKDMWNMEHIACSN